MPILECVPNISEGRDAPVIAACVAAVEAAGVPVLDLHTDPDHHRSVLTFAGAPDRVVAAAHALAATAIERIDLGRHTGVHPRIGAIDVVPFVPIAGLSIDEAAAMARAFGAALARRWQLPVFLYEAAAPAPTRARLEAIRRGGLAGLAQRMASDPAWQPDYGPAHPHPTAGATVTGARVPLIAFNVNLATDRLEAARAIAALVRERSGGLPAVKALGLPLAGRGLVQVSMNLVDYRITSIRTAFDRILAEAQARGIDVVESELVGLAPAAALDDATAAHVRLRDYDATRILEHHLAARG